MALRQIRTTGDTVAVEAKALDSGGVNCLDSRIVVRFGFTGDGRLLDNLGTSTGSRQVEMFNGRAVISVQLSGDAVVSVSSSGLSTAFLELKGKPATPAVPR